MQAILFLITLLLAIAIYKPETKYYFYDHPCLNATHLVQRKFLVCLSRFLAMFICHNVFNINTRPY